MVVSSGLLPVSPTDTHTHHAFPFYSCPIMLLGTDIGTGPSQNNLPTRRDHKQTVGNVREVQKVVVWCACVHVW